MSLADTNASLYIVKLNLAHNNWTAILLSSRAVGKVANVAMGIVLAHTNADNLFTVKNLLRSFYWK